MTPNIAVHSSQDTNLARKAAKSFIGNQAHESPEKIVNDLLERLQKVKRRRELKGLNHWEEYAPNYLQRLLRRRDALRLRAAEEFFRVEQRTGKALARAESMLGNRAEAEDAVSEAYLALLTGKTRRAVFYRKLWQVCMDRIRARTIAAKLFSQRHDLGIHGEEATASGPFSHSISDGDPLDIMLRQEEIEEGIREVQTKRKHRRSRKLIWWAELLSYHSPKEVVGKRLAQTHM